jgi:hypothetical protein
MQSAVAYEEILKAIDLGSLLLSEETLGRLKQYTEERSKASAENSRIGHLDVLWGVADKCLKDLIRSPT